MTKRYLLILGTILLLSIQYGVSVGQESDVVIGEFKTDNKRPYIINSSNEPIDISYYILKEGNKKFEFKADTTSVEYKYLSTLNPEWIKSVEILKTNKKGQDETGLTTILVMTLKRKTLKKLPADMRQRFH